MGWADRFRPSLSFQSLKALVFSPHAKRRLVVRRCLARKRASPSSSQPLFRQISNQKSSIINRQSKGFLHKIQPAGRATPAPASPSSRRPSARASLPGPENHRKSGQVALKIILAVFAVEGQLATDRLGTPLFPPPQTPSPILEFKHQIRNEERDQRPETRMRSER